MKRRYEHIARIMKRAHEGTLGIAGATGVAVVVTVSSASYASVEDGARAKLELLRDQLPAVSPQAEPRTDGNVAQWGNCWRGNWRNC